MPAESVDVLSGLAITEIVCVYDDGVNTEFKLNLALTYHPE